MKSRKKPVPPLLKPQRCSKLASTLPGILPRGLMAIPKIMAETGGGSFSSFTKLKALFDACRSAGHDLDILSMGMSAGHGIGHRRGQYNGQNRHRFVWRQDPESKDSQSVIITFIGGGNMATALGFRNDGSQLPTTDDFASLTPAKMRASGSCVSMALTRSSRDHRPRPGSDVIILAVKPQIMPAALADLAPVIEPGQHWCSPLQQERPSAAFSRPSAPISR